MLILGTKTGSSGRANNTPNHWAISLAPIFLFLFWDRGSLYSWNLLCRTVWPPTSRDPCTSASQRLVSNYILPHLTLMVFTYLKRLAGREQTCITRYYEGRQLLLDLASCPRPPLLYSVPLQAVLAHNSGRLPWPGDRNLKDILQLLFSLKYIYVKLSMIAHSCNACHPITWQVVTGESVQGHPQLRGQFKVTLSYMSPFIS